MMRSYAGLWFPDDGTLTKALKVRLDEQETYRGDRLAEALDQVRDFSTVIECGAHVGTWTRVLAARFHRVIAIEPDPQNFECLVVNTNAFVCVEHVNAAAGEHDGKAYIAARKTRMATQISDRGIEVPMLTIDGMNVARCGYLKVHVNGYEWPALKGAEQTIRRCRPVMTVVFKPRLQDYGTSADEMLEWILALGYRQGRGQDPYKVFLPA